MPDVAAIVLCGGESRRMGRSKADLPFGAETLLQRVVRLVGSAARPVVVAAAFDQEIPPLPDGVVIVRDPPSPRGPLQGLSSGLAALPAEAELVYVAPVDAPFFTPEWLRALVAMIGDHDAVTPVVGGFANPVNALYRIEPTRRAVASLLERNEYRARQLGRILHCREASEVELRRVDPDLAPLLNLNDPNAYRRALDLWAARESQAGDAR